MFCYSCGCRLSEYEFCTGCGADVSLYKKIMNVSNLYYNEGLEKAGVRDLSGAIRSLRQSLKFNKNNIEARNLLGLVYFEMGEVVAALSEWVISKNLRPNKNIADDYIGMIQTNASRLEAINQTIKKYNQALTYCIQDSKDLAIIQLKKVLSLNPRFVRAHQLLALLYIDSEQWERAARELKRCMEIDKNNTMTLRYKKEVEGILNADDGKGKNNPGRKNEKNDDVVRYQSDNEIIIQPVNVKEPQLGNVSSLINIGIGLVIGLAAMYFLVVPGLMSRANSESQNQVKDIANQLDVKTAAVTELDAQITRLQEENTSLKGELDGYVGADGTLSTIDDLLSAANAYITTEDKTQTAEALEAIAAGVDVETTSEAFKTLYNTLLTSIGPELAAEYYTEGSDAYRSENFEEAIKLLTKAVYYDSTNGDALFALGNAYRRNGNTEEASSAYEKVVELFPGTERARKSTQYLEEIGGGQ